VCLIQGSSSSISGSSDSLSSSYSNGSIDSIIKIAEAIAVIAVAVMVLVVAAVSLAVSSIECGTSVTICVLNNNGSINQGFSGFCRPSVVFAIAYRLTCRKVLGLNEDNVLKLHENVLICLLLQADSYC
jgi:hypothetical protein